MGQKSTVSLRCLWSLLMIQFRSFSKGMASDVRIRHLDLFSTYCATKIIEAVVVILLHQLCVSVVPMETYRLHSSTTSLVRDVPHLVRAFQMQTVHSIVPPTALDRMNNAGTTLAVSESNSTTTATEVLALSKFKLGIHRDPNGVLDNWNSSDVNVCTWTGVICWPHVGKVKSLNLSGQQLEGYISPELGNLALLTVLDLSVNNFTKTFPPSLGNCSLLSVLDLHSNQLTGSIAPELGRLVDLQYMNLGLNQLTGTIPASLKNASVLTTLSLPNNMLGGKIPQELGLLHALKVLDLGFNSFLGVIPSSLGNCSQLTHLILQRNRFSGEIPVEFGHLQQISRLALSVNNFTAQNVPAFLGQLGSLATLGLGLCGLKGEVPPSIGNCTSLTDLEFGENYLSGNLPVEFGSLTSLEYLSFESNLLTGTIPTWLGNFSKLSDVLSLDYNFFVGNIPSELGLLSQLSVMNLGVNNLTGMIPSSLGNCTALQNLELYQNQLIGGIPPEFKALVRLQTLSIGSNHLSGPIQTFLGNYSSLMQLDLGGNYFSGTIPAEMGSMGSLSFLILGANNLSGNIPPSLGNASVLRTVALYVNNLSGSLPSSLGSLPNLQRLYLEVNRLSGGFPSFLSNCSNLGDLDLSGNLFSGSLPHNIGQFPTLSGLHLLQNQLTGSIPYEIGNCTQLLYLSLSTNFLSGNIPTQLGNLVNLQVGLDLSYNNLSGPIPSDLGRLVFLVLIDLSFNNLSGSIPDSISDCKGLQSLNLTHNNLNGNIPVSLEYLNILQVLNLSFNNLDGLVPDLGVFQNLTATSFLGNPGLCGHLVHRNCPSPTQSCKGFKCRQVWIPVATVFPVAFVVASVFAVILWRLFFSQKQHREPWGVITIMDHRLKITTEELLIATNNFGADHKIGAGVSSTVYRAELPGGLVVAVKLYNKELDDDIYSSESTFAREVNTLGTIRHKNLLRILGCCSNLEFRALVLEYMPNGNLHKLLHEEDLSSPLSWATRLKISLGISKALLYLHHECHEPLIHRDLKPSNILLDENLEPKVSDFGTAKFIEGLVSGEAQASKLCGTIGYMAPEYATSPTVSTKGDVYSFGVLLLELMTGRQPTEGEDTSIIEWTQRFFPNRMIEVLDKSLLEEFDSHKEEMTIMFKWGLLCTNDDPQRRPSIKVVVDALMDIEHSGLNPSNTIPSIDELLSSHHELL